MSSPKVAALRREFRRLASPTKVKASRWFFQTGADGYGAGDKFYGVTVPVQRALAKQYRSLPLAEIWKLLESPYHEERLTALFILVDAYRHSRPNDQDRIVRGYLAHARSINNWDLVDSSAPQILGEYLLSHSRKVLYQLARSPNVWERRMAVVATQTLIRHREFKDTLRLAQQLLRDDHDLIHKATGWMLREVGNRNPILLRKFFASHVGSMPRTMLRYAIEKLPPRERRTWLLFKH